MALLNLPALIDGPLIVRGISSSSATLASVLRLANLEEIGNVDSNVNNSTNISRLVTNSPNVIPFVGDVLVTERSLAATTLRSVISLNSFHDTSAFPTSVLRAGQAYIPVSTDISSVQSFSLGGTVLNTTTFKINPALGHIQIDESQVSQVDRAIGGFVILDSQYTSNYTTTASTVNPNFQIGDTVYRISAVTALTAATADISVAMKSTTALLTGFPIEIPGPSWAYSPTTTTNVLEGLFI